MGCTRVYCHLLLSPALAPAPPHNPKHHTTMPSLHVITAPTPLALPPLAPASTHLPPAPAPTPFLLLLLLLLFLHLLLVMLPWQYFLGLIYVHVHLEPLYRYRCLLKQVNILDVF